MKYVCVINIYQIIRYYVDINFVQTLMYYICFLHALYHTLYNLLNKLSLLSLSTDS